jgi:hypothetical protein
MDWSMLGAIGEILGAATVAASLLYLARQMKHASRVAAAEGIEEYTSRLVDFAIAIAQDDTLADLIVRAQGEGLRRDDLSRAERGRVGYAYFAAVAMNASLFQRWRQGLLTDAEFENNSMRAEGLMAAPYFRDVWPILAPNFPDDYGSWVERRFSLQPEHATRTP